MPDVKVRCASQGIDGTPGGFTITGRPPEPVEPQQTIGDCIDEARAMYDLLYTQLPFGTWEVLRSMFIDDRIVVR